MRARDHIVLGGGAAATLVPFLGLFHSALFWAASVLIDVDHYIDFLWHNRFRDLSPRRMFVYHGVLFRLIRTPGFVGLNLFHTVEFMGGVLLLGLWTGSTPLLVVVAAMVFHLGLDLIQLFRMGIPAQRALSVIEYWLRRKALHRRGVDPDRVYRMVLAEMYPAGFEAAPPGAVPLPHSPREGGG